MHAADGGALGSRSAESRPRLFCFPSSDREFAMVVGEVAGGLPLKSPGELLEALRARYPLVSVHPRQLIGDPVWYVYRERMFPAHPDDIRDD